MTTLRRYELLILTVPEITQDETKDLEKQVASLIKDRKGVASSFERWGKYRLAYPVRNNAYGIYFLARFDVPDAINMNSDIRSLFRIKFDAVVMRNLVSKLDENQPLEYHRPRSLEEAPTGEPASLLKNKKVEGLISAVNATRSTKKETTPKKSAPKQDVHKKTVPEKEAAPEIKTQTAAQETTETAPEQAEKVTDQSTTNNEK